MSNVIDMYSLGSGYGDADFDIETRPLFHTSREAVNMPVNKRAIVRTDTDECLGVVGPKYKPINHKEMIAHQRLMIMRSDLDTKNLIESIVTDRNGARCYVKHTLPNQFLETPDGDTAALSFLGVNSFDGLFSFMMSAGARQSVCMNGQIFTEGSSTIYKSRHTQQLDIHKGSRIVGKGLEVMMQQNELWKIWYKTVPSHEIIKSIFAATINGDPLDEKTGNNKNYIQLWKLYKDVYKPRQGANLWAVYNALTHWATHCQPSRKSSSIISLQNRRANKVSEVISNDHLFRKAA